MFRPEFIISSLVTLSMWTPSTVTVYDFSHLEGITVSISKNSPPRAILEDEMLLVQREAPAPRELEPAANQVVAEKTETMVGAEIRGLSFGPLKISIKPIQTASAEIRETVVPKERAPEFGEAFRNTTIIKDTDGSDSTTPNQMEDLLKETRVVRYRGIAPAPNLTEPLPVNPQEHKAKHETTVTRFSKPQGEAPPSQILVEGTLELSKGLAFVTGSTLEVFIDLNGQAVAVGEVSVEKGTYQIQVPGRAEGALVAELRDSEGFLTGRAQFRTENILRGTKEIKKKFNITLFPVNQGLLGRVASVYAADKGEPVVTVTLPGLTMSAETNKSGRFHHPGLLHDSQVIIRTNKKGYWGTIALSDNYEQRSLQVYPEKMIQALTQFMGTDADISDHGIIFGKAEIDGKPADGVQLELDDDNAVGPIYFNALQLPDSNLEATTSNGLYAYIRLEPGVHVLKAKKLGKALPSKTFISDAGAVSAVNIEITDRQKATARVFDALTGQPVPATLEFFGSDRNVFTDDGDVVVKYHSGEDLMFLEAEVARGYFRARQIVSRNQTYMNFPMVRHTWLDEIGNQARVNRMPQTGVAVGFVRGAEFEILSSESMGGAQVLYFDAGGKYVGQSYGPRDGGFIILNAPQGLHTIAIAPKSKAGISSRLIFSDSRAISLINYRF